MTNKLKEIRLERNFSQEDVAFKLGISQKAYSKLENGQTCISLNRILQLAETYNIEPSSICAKGCDCSKYIQDYKQKTIDYLRSMNAEIPAFMTGENL